MKNFTYRGFEIAIDLQPRGRGHCLVAIDIRRGAAAWARYRDVPALRGVPLESVALSEAHAVVDDIVTAEAAPYETARGAVRLVRGTTLAA